MDDRIEYYMGVKKLLYTSDDYTYWATRVKTKLQCLGENEEGWEVTDPNWITEQNTSKKVLLKAVSSSDASKRKIERQAFDMILSFIGGEVAIEAMDGNIEHPRDLWNSISNLFCNRPGGEKSLALTRLVQMKPDDNSSVDVYVKNFSALKQKCIEMGWAELSDNFFAIIFLAGLPEDTFGPMCQTLLLKGEHLTFKEARGAVELNLLRHENSNDAGLKHTDKTGKHCVYCGRDGHNERECFKKKREVNSKKKKKSSNVKKKKATKDDTSSGNDSDNAYYLNEIDDSSEYSYISETTFDSLNKTSEVNHTWVGDCAATRHMTSNDEIFISLQKVQNHYVKMGDNRRIPVKGIGKIRIKSESGKIHLLNEVLYVPDLQCNLLSIRLLQKSGLTVKFPSLSKMMFVKNSRGRCVMRGELTNNLYIMKFEPLKLVNQNGTAYISKEFADHNETAYISEELAHQRLGHRSYNQMKLICAWDPKFHIKRSASECDPCTGCAKGKLRRRRRKTYRKNNATNILDCIHSDIHGPFKFGAQGYKYFATFIDERSRKGKVYFLRKRNEVLSMFHIYRQWAETNTGLKIKRLQSDGGGEYTSKKFESYLAQAGIEHYITNADEARQNGIAERYGGLIKEMGFSMLKHAQRPMKYWPYAIQSAVQINNYMPHSILKNLSPHYVWTGEHPNIHHLRTFGCEAWIRRKNPVNGEDKSVPCIFLGYRDGLKGYLFISKITGKIIKSGDAVFHERLMAPPINSTRVWAPNQCLDEEDDNLTLIPTSTKASTERKEIESDDKREARPHRKNTNYNVDYKALHNGRQLSSHIENAFRAAELSSGIGQLAMDIHIPTSLSDALSSVHAVEWKQAMEEEISSLSAHATWSDPIDVLPSDKKCVGTKWVFDVKRDSTGRVVRFKARLVAKGFTQREGVDYNKTFSPVLQTSLLRTMLALAANNNWEIDQIDIKTAFLYGEIDKEIYIRLPTGSVHRLKKGIYGLKQAGRLFYGRFHKSLSAFGLERIDGDPCCYIKESNDGPLYVMIHVDDCIIIGPHRTSIDRLKNYLNEEYDVKDLGPLKYCLGWEIRRDRKNGTLSISQQQYVHSILKRYGMANCSIVSTPSDPKTTFSKTMAPKNTTEQDYMSKRPYLELLGCLLYLATSSRPDIAFAVNDLARYSSNPGIAHWKGLKRILRYLKGTANYGLGYGLGHDRLYGYTDANYARCPDTRKSRYGGLLMINSAAVDWKSKMQNIVALSSMESEYIGACELVRSASWLKQCLRDLGREQGGPIPIGIDNLSAKVFAEEHMVQHRSKHIDTKHHYIRQQIAAGVVRLFHQPTKHMPADALTKPLGPKLHRRFRRQMGVRAVAPLLTP